MISVDEYKVSGKHVIVGLFIPICSGQHKLAGIFYMVLLFLEHVIVKVELLFRKQCINEDFIDK